MHVLRAGAYALHTSVYMPASHIYIYMGVAHVSVFSIAIAVYRRVQWHVLCVYVYATHRVVR